MDKPIVASMDVADVSFSNKPYLYAIAFLFLLAMHYYQPNGGGQGLSLAFNNTVWVAISLIIAVGAWRISATKRIFYTTFDWVGLIAIVALATPLLWADSPWREATFDRYLAIIAFWLIILTHRQFQLSDREQQCLWGLVSGGVLIQCVVGLVQYAHAGEWMIIPNGRPSGTFQQVNVYASFLATGLALSAYQLFQYQLSRLAVSAHLLIVFLIGILQWLVFSRTGLLGCALVFVGLGILYRRQKSILLQISLVFIVGGGGAIGLQQISNVEGRNLDNVKSPGYRTTQYSLSWELIKEKPLLGHGLGRFQTVFLEEQAEAYATGRINSIHGSRVNSHPHNELLYWWVEAGALPILVFLMLAVFVFRSAWCNRGPQRFSCLIILLPILLHTQTEYPFYHSSIHLVLLSILLTFITSNGAKAVALQFQSLPILFGGLFFILCTLFMSTNLHTMYVLGRYVGSNDAYYLSKIVNPFGHSHHLSHFRSRELVRVNSSASLLLAEKLLNHEVILRPNESAYAHLYKVYRLQNKGVDGERLLAKAKVLFPVSEYFAKFPEKMPDSD